MSFRFAIFVGVVSILFAACDLAVSHKVHDSGIIVLTGATSGLVLDAGIEFAKLGYTVLAGARNQKKADALRKQVDNENFVPIVLDWTSSEGIQNFVKTVNSYDMPLVALIKSAGVSNEGFEEDEDFACQCLKAYDTLRSCHYLTCVIYSSYHEITSGLWGNLEKSQGRIVEVGSFDPHLTGAPKPPNSLFYENRDKRWKWGISMSLVTGFECDRKHCLGIYDCADSTEVIAHRHGSGEPATCADVVDYLQQYVPYGWDPCEEPMASFLPDYDPIVSSEYDIYEDSYSILCPVLMQQMYSCEPCDPIGFECDRKQCLGFQLKDAITSAYVHAVTSSRPNSIYDVASAGVLDARLLTWMTYDLPNRVYNIIAPRNVPKRHRKKRAKAQ